MCQHMHHHLTVWCIPLNKGMCFDNDLALFSCYRSWQRGLHDFPANYSNKYRYLTPLWSQAILYTRFWYHKDDLMDDQLRYIFSWNQEVFIQGNGFKDITWGVATICSRQVSCRAVSRLAPSQRETSLQCNAVSHWLGANLESALSWTWFQSIHKNKVDNQILWNKLQINSN